MEKVIRPSCRRTAHLIFRFPRARTSWLTKPNEFPGKHPQSLPVDREDSTSTTEWRREPHGQIATAEGRLCGRNAVQPAGCRDRQTSVGRCPVLVAAVADSGRTEAIG